MRILDFVFELVFLPLAIVFFWAKRLWRVSRLFWRKSAKTPVISVDNLTISGMGTTAVIREIAKALNVPVLVNAPRIKTSQVRESDTAKDVGVDAKILAESGLAVYAGKAEDALDMFDCGTWPIPKAAVVSGGAENPSIKKDVSILVANAPGDAKSRYLLPSGRTNWTLSGGVKNASAVLINPSVGGVASARVLELAKRHKKPVFFVKSEIGKTGMVGKFVAFAGKNPNWFFGAIHEIATLRAIEKIRFPERRFLTQSDLIELFRLAKEYDAGLITTEEDWIKLPKNIRAKVRHLAVKTTIQPNFYSWLEKKLERNDEEK